MSKKIPCLAGLNA